MKDTLIYDAASMSRTPLHALVVALILMALAIGVWLWRRAHGQPFGGLAIWFAGASLLLLLVAGLTEYEKRGIATKVPLQVEGPVEGVWEKRTLRNPRKQEFWEWQGFRIRGVEFAYVRNTDTNYFNNAGAHRIDLVDGMRLRVHYLESQEGDAAERHIVRVERLVSGSTVSSNP
ncbi:MAG: hypothetical protein ABW034_17705 [Steroidobacteraceae bacterium]